MKQHRKANQQPACPDHNEQQQRGRTIEAQRRLTLSRIGNPCRQSRPWPPCDYEEKPSDAKSPRSAAWRDDGLERIQQRDKDTCNSRAKPEYLQGLIPPT